MTKCRQIRDSGEQNEHQTDTEQYAEQSVNLLKQPHFRIVLHIKDTLIDFLFFFAPLSGHSGVLFKFLLRLHLYRIKERILRAVQPLSQMV